MSGNQCVLTLLNVLLIDAALLFVVFFANSSSHSVIMRLTRCWNDRSSGILLLCCSLLTVSLIVTPRLASADCIVTAPAFGSLGTCTSPLKSGEACSFKCDFPYALSPTPALTQC